MKVALAQLNYTIGDFKLNAEKIIKSSKEAHSKGADLILFSELSICGYPPHDLLEKKEFIDQCLQSVDKVAAACPEIGIIVGGPSINTEDKGKKIRNTAFFLHQGKVQQSFHKSLLPTYDVFDEYRYFEPNEQYDILEFCGKKIAVTICEDIWENQPVNNPFAKSRLYKKSPMEELAKLNPELIVNIAASPFSYVQEGTRKDVLTHNATKYGLPVVYVNQVGANTELVFDGNSVAVNELGERLVSCARFKEALEYIDFNKLPVPNTDLQIEEDHIPLIDKSLTLGIKDYFEKMGFKKAILGLSGGIDSAVTAVLAVQALGAENVQGVLMPSQFSSDHSVSDAIALAENLNIKYDIIPIKNIYEQFEAGLSEVFLNLPFNVAEENIQARVRGTLLMAMSNKFGNILLNTTNKSEMAVGYGTLYGDMNGGMSVLGDVYKVDVFKLAHYQNRNGELIPENTISKPPSAELRPDQKDSDSLPDYGILDGILFRYIELNQSPDEIVQQGYEEATVVKTIRMVNNNEYKRFQAAPVLRISSKAFGFGRRMPLVARYS